MKVFTASNGIIFTITEDGVLEWEGGYDHHRVTAALREYFQAERDEQLGRWRDPENPDYVVYPVAGAEATVVAVVCETDGFSTVKYRGTVTGRTTRFERVAFHYFAAHPEPEPEPKPWLDAKSEEVWEICMDGANLLCRSDSDGDFTPVFGHYLWAEISNGSPGITAGRRVWPEDDK